MIDCNGRCTILEGKLFSSLLFDCIEMVSKPRNKNCLGIDYNRPISFGFTVSSNPNSKLLGCKPIPSLDECLGELLREEQCCLTKTAMGQKGSVSSPLDIAYATQV